MRTFLQAVAADLYKRCDYNLSQTAVVFPNKRAGLFFNEYLAQLSDTPIWSPSYISISDFFAQNADLKLGDPIQMICELYYIFIEETASTESLDEFYLWGELLISDFDDVDKNLVDADKLFANLHDLKDIMNDYNFLEPEQEEAIKQFFKNFSIEKHTELKERFTNLWNKLGSIYTRFRKRLEVLGIAYEGMLYRRVIEHINAEELPYQKYAFVGFNALNKVEHKLFSLLRDHNKAFFYWDYDTYYTEKSAHYNEAGEFVLRNLKDFPNLLPTTEFNHLSQLKKVSFISAATENSQARYIPYWIKDTLGKVEKDNAIVLCNETNLLPVLHAIPQQVENINITMGYPLIQTPIYSFIIAVLNMQTEGYQADRSRFCYNEVQCVLKHPYTQQLSSKAQALEHQLTAKNIFYPSCNILQQDSFLTLLFTPQNSNLDLCRYITNLIKQIAALYQTDTSKNDPENPLYIESLFKTYTTVNRLNKLIEDNVLNVHVLTLQKLINRILTNLSIPFHGEPAIGLQIMGVLETRNLDFKNLLMLSLNEGKLPKKSSETSFIPYNLRKAFGMTTIEHKNAVYAYYFYRLIQRAENITLLYNTTTDGVNSGEWSRFMLQLLLEWPHPIERYYLETGNAPILQEEIRIPKTPEIKDVLWKKYDKRKNPQAHILSPSALNTYLDCSLKFYYRYVAGIKQPDEVSAEIDSALFGTIFHKSAELLYNDLTSHGKTITPDNLKELLANDAQIQNYVNRAFKEEFFHTNESEKVDYNGTQLINFKVITTYIKQLLRNDLRYAPFQLIATEKTVHEDIDLSNSETSLTIALGGTIDRMDLKDNILRIVDYKTGGKPNVLNSIDQLFIPDEKRPNYILQAFIYAYIMCKQQEHQVSPALLYIHQAANSDYSPIIEVGEARKAKTPIDDFSIYKEEFIEKLTELLKDIFLNEIPFTQTENSKACAYCDFRSLCKR